MTQGILLAQELEGTRDWTLKLLADLSGDDWTFQPGEGLPHALWLCGHLTSSQNTLVHVRCLGAGVLDSEFNDHFPIGAPVKSAGEHDYPAVETVLKRMSEIQIKTLEAVRGMTDEVMDKPASGKDGKPHPHYRDVRGAVAHCNRHEAFHAGQLAMIRRLLGKSFLR
jgi:hypothetical protein